MRFLKASGSENGIAEKQLDWYDQEELHKKEVSRMQDAQNAMKHLREHQKYPATKADLVAECDDLSDFSPADKEEFSSKLPEGTYNSAEEVMAALGWSEWRPLSPPVTPIGRCTDSTATR